MNRIKTGLIIFCAFLSVNAAGSNPSFNDTISIPGAKCIISIPIDSNSLFSSFEHPCVNYYFFKLGNYCPCCRLSNLLIRFTSSIKCTLFVRSVQFHFPPDTLPISCDSLPYYFGGDNYQYNIPSVVSVNDSIQWVYECPIGKRLAKAKQFNYYGGDLLHLILKSTNDSSELNLSRTIVHLTPIKTSPSPSKITNKTNT